MPGPDAAAIEKMLEEFNSAERNYRQKLDQLVAMARAVLSAGPPRK